jgi:hypothetical protein
MRDQAPLSGARDVGAAAGARLDALATEALQVLRTETVREANGDEEAERDHLAVVRAVNTVLFERHNFGIAPDVTDFPRNPR